jgi:UDP-glucose 4-epimerase/UDP-glucuronate decarboxylase
LITGGAGFVGYHLAEALAEDPADEVTLLDNLSRGAQDDELSALTGRPNVKLEVGDLRDVRVWERLETGYDEVYHLAAVIGVRKVVEHPAEVIRTNALSTLHLLDWLVDGGGHKVLFSSTSEAYAWTQHFHELAVPTPEDVPVSLTELADPRSSYAGSKIFGELAVTHYCRAHGRPFAIVRYHNVYGPRMGYEHVIPELFERASSGQDPLTVYSVDHRRAFCYVSDAVAATVAAMREPAAEGSTINVGNDREEVTIGELAERLLLCAGIQATISPQKAASDPVKRRCPDLTRARELLGYEPRVMLDDGLQRTLAWYADNLDR